MIRHAGRKLHKVGRDGVKHRVLEEFPDEKRERLRREREELIHRVCTRLHVSAYNGGELNYKWLFEKQDHDRNAVLTWGEFHSTCRRVLHLAETDEQLQEVFRLMNSSGSGKVTLTELVAFIENALDDSKPSYRTSVLQMFTPRETTPRETTPIETTPRPSTPRQPTPRKGGPPRLRTPRQTTPRQTNGSGGAPEDLFSKLDKNNDGVISRSEYLAGVRSKQLVVQTPPTGSRAQTRPSATPRDQLRSQTPPPAYSQAEPRPSVTPRSQLHSQTTPPAADSQAQPRPSATPRSQLRSQTPPPAPRAPQTPRSSVVPAEALSKQGFQHSPQAAGVPSIGSLPPPAGASPASFGPPPAAKAAKAWAEASPPAKAAKAWAEASPRFSGSGPPAKAAKSWGPASPRFSGSGPPAKAAKSWTDASLASLGPPPPPAKAATPLGIPPDSPKPPPPKAATFLGLSPVSPESQPEKAAKANTSSPDELSVFSIFDKNKDGVLSRSELQAGLDSNLLQKAPEKGRDAKVVLFQETPDTGAVATERWWDGTTVGSSSARESRSVSPEGKESAQSQGAKKRETTPRKKKKVDHAQQEKEDELLHRVCARLRAAAYTTGGKDWAKLFHEQDKDKSGEIDWDEFYNMCRKVLKLTDQRNDLRTIFNRLDEDGSGQMSIDELVEVVSEKAVEGESVRQRKAEQAAKARARSQEIYGDRPVWSPSMDNTAENNVGMTACSRRYFSNFTPLLRGTTYGERSASSGASTRNLVEAEDEEIYERLRSRMRAAAYTSGGKDWAKLFREQDKDNSGEISWEEFYSMCRRVLHLSDADSHLRKVFRRLDADGSGEVSIEELVEMVTAPPAKSASGAIKQPNWVGSAESLSSTNMCLTANCRSYFLDFDDKPVREQMRSHSMRSERGEAPTTDRAELRARRRRQLIVNSGLFTPRKHDTMSDASTDFSNEPPSP